MIKNLDQFTRRMATIQANVDKNLERNIRKSATVILRDVTLATPVDTGRLRANTNVGIGQADLTDGPGVGPSGGKNAGPATQLALQRGQARIKQHQPGQSIHISNNTEYAQIVEEGTATRPGTHFFKRGVQYGVAALKKAKILE